jgi:hypothetical protein
MATYETSKSGQAGVVPGTGWNRVELVQEVSVALTTAMLDNANDDVGLFYLPAGAVVTGIVAGATDMDSATGLLFDIGDSADEDRLLAASTIGQAGTLSTALARTGLLYKYTAKTQIRAYINTAATTPVAGTLNVVVRFFLDPEYSSTALVAA